MIGCQKLARDLAEKLIEGLEKADPNRTRFTQHFYQRARRRNIDASSVKYNLRKRDFVEVRENNRSDPQFEFSYKVTMETGNQRYEVPLYFNIPGPKILVKSVWPR